MPASESKASDGTLCPDPRMPILVLMIYETTNLGQTILVDTARLSDRRRATSEEDEETIILTISTS